MTDSSMNFGPAWIRNLHSEPSVAPTGSRYQLAKFRYGREEMLALFDKSVKPPETLINFKTLFSDQTQIPLALLPTTEEEQRSWQARPTALGGAARGRGGSLERGGRVPRGRGGYQPFGRATSAHEVGWGNGEQPDWSPRKEFGPRPSSDNWRRGKGTTEDEEGWRSVNASARPLHEKWTRSTSWRGESEAEVPAHRNNWHGQPRRGWDNEDHLPEWAMENPTEGGGTFDERGAFHGSDDEHEGRAGKHEPLQKSVSQQNIGNRAPPFLTSSKSALSLSKTSKAKEDTGNLEKDIEAAKLRDTHSPPDKERGKETKQKHEKPPSEKDSDHKKAKAANKPSQHSSDRSSSSNGDGSSQDPLNSNNLNIDRVDEDFDRLQEDLVLKLVVDEDGPKPLVTGSSFDMPQSAATAQHPPPNLVQSIPPQPPGPNSQEKWYYQDPQGIRQGPFLNLEMAEWFKAGYFSNQLNVMRECDERYFLLGELITLCNGDNPFLANVRFPVLKNDPGKVVVVDEPPLPYSLLAQFAQFKQQTVGAPQAAPHPPPPPAGGIGLAEPWNALSLQQQELAAKRLLLQQQQLSHDLQFMQQSSAPSNHLMYMINQMQQNKLPNSVLSDKTPSAVLPNQLDPLLAQMAANPMHPLQQRLQNPSLHNPLPSAAMPPIPPMADSHLATNLSNLQQQQQQAQLPGGHHSNLTRPPPVDQHLDPVFNFLKQYQQQQRQQAVESLWHKQNFNTTPTPPMSTPTSSQWQQPPPPPDSGLAGMWDLKQQQQPQPPPQQQQQSEVQSQQPTATIQQQQQQQEKALPKKEAGSKDEREAKKRKEVEEKQTKKEADERRKMEQRRQEADKKAAEEKKKRDEEKRRKDLEKAKKEAEEKRMRELEEKRKQKEQRKAELEARKKTEDGKKDEEKNRHDPKTNHTEDRNKIELARLVQNASSATKSSSSSSPKTWSQTSATAGMSLSDIQKAEKEKRAQEAALLLQRQQQMLLEQQQQQLQQQHSSQLHDKNAGGLQLNWAKKPLETQKVKSFAEIQAEEHENLVKMTAEARLLKEKEAPTMVQNNAGIWNGQTLTWASVSSTSQWNSSTSAANNSAGFWDEVPAEKKVNQASSKPSVVAAVAKSNSTGAMTTKPAAVPPQKQQAKATSSTKTKKEDGKMVNNNNRDEFTEWCHKTLANISADVDIPTFVTFLRDIEPAYDVRDYCKEYLGDSAATQQFASNFLEKRRSFKPKSNNAPKDDMCSPAPAITPSMQHNNSDFQEVKGKNKKNKKSKMLKVDSRILGFNVTSAPDRINVGDRDYGES